MKRKRGQFYLVTIVLLIGIFIGVIALQNSYRKELNISLNDLEDEISFEKNKLFDHIAYNDLSVLEINSLFSQFSNDYINKTGKSKSVIFLFGNSTDVEILGNIKRDGIFSYNGGSEIVEIGEGDFSTNIDPLQDLSIIIESSEYNFSFSETQNIYYIIRHDYNNEVHIVSG